MEAAFHDPGAFDLPVVKVMGPKLPTIGIGQPMQAAVEMLEHMPALLVLSGGRPTTVLTRTDILSFLGQAATAASPGPNNSNANGADRHG
jgi:cystathionine beta-synthase